MNTKGSEQQSRSVLHRYNRQVSKQEETRQQFQFQFFLRRPNGLRRIPPSLLPLTSRHPTGIGLKMKTTSSDLPNFSTYITHVQQEAGASQSYQTTLCKSNSTQPQEHYLRETHVSVYVHTNTHMYSLTVTMQKILQKVYKMNIIYLQA